MNIKNITSHQDRSLIMQLKGFEPKLIFDIGANQGESVHRFKRLWSDCPIVSFEPRVTAFRMLEEVAKEYSGVTCFNFALGETDGPTEMSEILDDNSLHGGRSTFLEYVDLPPKHSVFKCPVMMKRFDEFAHIYPAQPGIFIKLDCEGYEKHVIDGGKEMISRAHACLIEVNLNDKYKKDQTRPEDIATRMRDLGFKRSGPTRRVMRGASKVVLWQDELWIKK